MAGSSVPSVWCKQANGIHLQAVRESVINQGTEKVLRNCSDCRSLFLSGHNPTGVVQLLSFFPEKKMQHFRSITGVVEGVMLPPRVVRIDDEGRTVPPR